MGLVRGNIHDDFFEQNSELTILPSIKKLIEEKGKEEASKVMWAIYLMEDPQSTFYRIPREERILEVQREYYNFNPNENTLVVQEYCKLILTKEQWMLKSLSDAAEKQIIRLSDDSTHIDVQLKIMERMPKIFAGIENIRKSMKEEEGKTQLRANAKEGTMERRARKEQGVKTSKGQPRKEK